MRIETPSHAALRPILLARLDPLRGPLEALPEESGEKHENRVATALMARYRDTRESAAFEELYSLSRASVLAWIKSLLGRELAHLDPNELLQDTFINVYRYPAAFRDDHPGSFRVWVRTIAGNVLRRAAAQRGRTLPLATDEPMELVDQKLGPMQQVDDGEATDRLRRAWVLLLCLYAEAWKELSLRDRRTLHLVEVEGLSYQEAGVVLAVGRSNMKMIVFRSRKRIARRMRDALSRAAGRARPCSGPMLVA
ncbi:MAG: sigma-70 family RNA polymerase sigma factor [Planctomycetota bacterium]